MKCCNCDNELKNQQHNGIMYLICSVCNYRWTEKTLRLCRKNRRPRPKCHVLSLSYEPNGTDHADLILGIHDWFYRCDTYYYELDHPANSDPDTIKAIRTLLHNWLADIRNIKRDTLVFLPYDFSDQYSGWIQCHCDESGQITLIPGWFAIAGWSFYPSAYYEQSVKSEDFKPLDTAIHVRTNKDALLSDIASSLQHLHELGDRDTQ